MQIRPTAFTIGLITYFFIALFAVYTKFGIHEMGITCAYQIMFALCDMGEKFRV
jgi:hypothetical protein